MTAQAASPATAAAPLISVWGLGERHFLLDLIAPTEALQEPRCLGILHRLVLCSGVWYGRDLYLCILLRPDLCSGIMLPPDLCSGISLGPDLCPRIVYRPDVSVLLHGPERCSGIFRNLCRDIFRNLCRGILHNLCRGILNGLYGPNLCLRLFLGRPSLELSKQGFRWWLTIFRLTLTGGFRGGSNFVAGRRVLCGRRRILGTGN